ncbi:type II secretion system protein [Cerasicoccus maritimus]|uniref:type II secretion system protein n=1 Tax=Cerasicoccus maritimus TaxID=490089 RepID=UPI0028526693|nr:type II secretion system protein [Cerasicoccus maritimus]
MKHTTRAFTLVELLTVIAIVGILSSILIVAVGEVRFTAQKSQSASNIRQLANANLLYANDHGEFAPNADYRDITHWHGKRKYGKFDGTGGYLSDYLDGGQVRICPVFKDLMEASTGSEFDSGTGGYGYNATYYGARQDLWNVSGSSFVNGVYQPWFCRGNLPARIEDAANTVMFTSTAIVKGGGIVETGNSVPYRTISNGKLAGQMTPTCHFRFRGQAVVAWGDGHVTFEEPNDASTDHNAYGDDNDAHSVGWFGDTKLNGPWNPRSGMGLPY